MHLSDKEKVAGWNRASNPNKQRKSYQAHIPTYLIARALGGKRSGRGWIVPCITHDDRRPSLSLADGDDGRLLVHCFAGCDTRDILVALHARGLFVDNKDGEQTREFIRQCKAPDPAASYIPLEWSDRAECIWRTTISIIETPAETYLRSRGCFIPSCADIRFLPARQLMYPAMVARITDVITGKPLSLHFTFLLPDGSGKAPVERQKILLKGHRKAGGVIRLTDDAEVTSGLGIAEGIETALSVMQFGWQPVWASIDAGNIAAFPVQSDIECLTIFADNDNVGFTAAKKCCSRWQLAGRETKIILPKIPGFDWNDAWRAANE